MSLNNIMKSLTIATTLLFLITTVSCSEVVIDECKFTERNPLKLLEPGKKATTYCEKFNGSNNKCASEIKPYFKDMLETDEAIVEYVEHCKELGPQVCTEVIKYFKGLCYNMERIVELFKRMPNLINDYIRNNEYKTKFKVKYFTWKVLSENNVDVHLCLDLFLNADLKNDLVTAIDEYNYWLKTNSGNCNCIELFGIYHINFRSKFDKDPRMTNLRDKFSNLCVDNKHAWTAKQYQHIADSIKIVEKSKLNSPDNIPYEEIKVFLKKANPIGVAGWHKKKETEWPFKDVLKILKNDLNSPIYEEKANLIAVALKADFTLNDFNEFIKKTDIDGFNSIECRNNILNGTFKVEHDDKLNTIWKNYEKSFFNEHIDILIQIFKKHYKGENCSQFTARLKTLQNRIQKTKLSASALTAELKKAKESGSNFDSIIKV